MSKFLLDDNFIKKIGLVDIPLRNKKRFLTYVYYDLQDRVGHSIASSMTSEQMSSFQRIIKGDIEYIKALIEEYSPRYLEDEMYNKMLNDMKESTKGDLTAEDKNKLLIEFASSKWLETNRRGYGFIVELFFEKISNEILHRTGNYRDLSSWFDGDGKEFEKYEESSVKLEETACIYVKLLVAQMLKDIANNEFESINLALAELMSINNRHNNSKYISEQYSYILAEMIDKNVNADKNIDYFEILWKLGVRHCDNEEVLLNVARGKIILHCNKDVLLTDNDVLWLEKLIMDYPNSEKLASIYSSALNLQIDMNDLVYDPEGEAKQEALYNSFPTNEKIAMNKAWLITHNKKYYDPNVYYMRIASLEELHCNFPENIKIAKYYAFILAYLDRDTTLEDIKKSVKPLRALESKFDDPLFLEAYAVALTKMASFQDLADCQNTISIVEDQYEKRDEVFPYYHLKALIVLMEKQDPIDLRSSVQNMSNIFAKWKNHKDSFMLAELYSEALLLLLNHAEDDEKKEVVDTINGLRQIYPDSEVLKMHVLACKNVSIMQ
ncbi:MAG: hypothetical protein ACOYH0_05880 [Saccharofermentanales bacterium]